MTPSVNDGQRARIKELLARGLPSAYIAQQLGLRTMQVAAIKAHLTMGSYDQRSDSADLESRTRGDNAQGAGSRAVGVGIDIAEARRGLDLVALDGDRRVLVSPGRLSIDDVVQMTLELAPSVVCIDSPSGWATSGRSRLAERELAKVGIQAYRTPTDPGDHAFYRWMRVGFEVFAQLSDRYPLYSGGPVAGMAAEIFPHATTCLLAGGLRARTVPKESFRRAVLRDHRVSEDQLRTLDAVDAALGALTGLIALDGIRYAVGDPGEGVILLPISVMPDTPLLPAGAPSPATLVKASPKPPKRRGRSLDYDKARAFVEAVPAGKWTSYGDVAAAAGNRQGAQAIGLWALRNGHEIPNIHRVIRSDGFVADNFRAAGPGLPRDAPAVRELLIREGLRFDARGRASQSQRITPVDR